MKGVRYFSCPSKKGVFVRPDKVQLDKRGRAMRNPASTSSQDMSTAANIRGGELLMTNIVSPGWGEEVADGYLG